MASPAMAMKITNLDHVTHTVQLSGNGAAQNYTIEPNDTEIVTGASTGFLALVEPSAPVKKGKKSDQQPAHDGVVHADGLLSGIIGNERSSGIPADPEYSYVIWPGGHLAVQSRIHRGGAMF